jgi:hypothetical protein
VVETTGLVEGLRLLAAARSDTALCERLRSKHSLESIVPVARELGYSCTEEELREAFKHDWGLRWARFFR